MSLFSVNLPPLPDNIPIHRIEETPLLKLAKNLYLFTFLLAIIGNMLLQVMVMNNGSLETFLYINYIFNFVCILSLFFSFFCLCKLSLRKTLFKLYMIVFGISFAVNVLGWFLGIDPKAILEDQQIILSSSFEAYMFLVFIMLVIDCVLMWKIGKEQSFILHQEGFFKGTKIIMWSLVAMGLSLFLLSWGFLSSSEATILIASVIILATSIAMLIGCAIYLVAVFKINLIIAYGEQTPNPL